MSIGLSACSASQLEITGTAENLSLQEIQAWRARPEKAILGAVAATDLDTSLIKRAPVISRKTELIGLNGDEIERIFGRPSFQRRERPAQYWRYSYTDCTVGIYFFRAPDAPTLTVNHVDVTDLGLGDARRYDQCRALSERLGPNQGWDGAEVLSH